MPLFPVCSLLFSFILAQETGVIASLANPDSLWVMLFLAVMLIVLAVLLWTGKRLKGSKKLEE